MRGRLRTAQQPAFGVIAFHSEWQLPRAGERWRLQDEALAPRHSASGGLRVQGQQAGQARCEAGVVVDGDLLKGVEGGGVHRQGMGGGVGAWRGGWQVAAWRGAQGAPALAILLPGCSTLTLLT